MKRSSLGLFLLMILAACSNQDTAMNSVVANLYPDQASVGFKQFSKQCSSCHRPPMPNQHTDLEWAGVIALMQQHRAQAGYGAMSDDIKQQVLQYLQKHSQQGESS
ncbi:MAG: hypothetical protein COA61_007550 [Zetaproteobacteria bacterium]|nr:hypothetical protein [Zetaproteobacteria bacterium]